MFASVEDMRVCRRLELPDAMSCAPVPVSVQLLEVSEMLVKVAEST